MKVSSTLCVVCALVCAALGFASGVVTIRLTEPKPAYIPTKQVQTGMEYQAALLQCPVSTRGLAEWHEVCKARRRMGEVR